MTHYHFIAIGGAGMSGIARILLELGNEVSGSDIKVSEATRRLVALGAKVHIGHSAEHVPANCDTVVVSSAIHEDNPEVVEARRRGLNIVHRADMLAMLMARGKGIAIAGAHGKTTTTSMIAMALEKAGADPTILIGGEVTDFGGNARLGSGDIVVAEADESDGSFLKLEPYLAVVTNIDDDHLDYYENIENVKEAFRAFLDKVQPDGTVVYCSSDPATCEVVRDTAVRRLAYGLSGDAYITARDITKREWGSEFVVVAGDKVLGAVSLKVPGTHNVENALAAICVGWVLGFEFKALSEGLAGFGGAQRRLQHVGEQAGVLVLDDYAHHPTEVKASLRAIREHVEGRVICVYQPHRYSRTLALKEEFGTAFESCDILLLAPIYPGPGEKRMPDVDSSVIAIEVTQKTGKSASYFDSPETLVENAILLAEPGDAIVTMGAGDVYRLGPIILDRLSTT